MDDFCALTLFDKLPALTAGVFQDELQKLEPSSPVAVTETAAGLEIRCGEVVASVTALAKPLDDQQAVASIGMADLPEADAQRLMQHRCHVAVRSEGHGAPVEQMILLLKSGMVLCSMGGWALCVPSCGLCIQAPELENTIALNRQGPRVWGLDDAEGTLPAYQPKNLWSSLREDAQPASLLAGFVPAKVENTTWFFSAGHSLLGLPEIAYSDGSLEDFYAIRELFRYLLHYFYQNPEKMRAGAIVKTTDSALVFSLHELPERYGELQAATGTLRLRMTSSSEPGDEWN